MTYFAKTGNDPLVLVIGIIMIALLLIISIFLINKKCKNKKIKNAFYIALLIQIIILIIDNYIYPFPTIDLDAQAFEWHGWNSYITGVSSGRGTYNYYFINPIYKLIGVRVAAIFGIINIFFNILTNLNVYKIFRNLIKDRVVINRCMYISLLSPITLITRTGILRESLIVMLLSCSLVSFINVFKNKEKQKNLIKAFIYSGIATLFHSGVIFITTGYVTYLLKENKKSKIYNILFFIILILAVIILKDSLLKKFGEMDTEQIIKQQNYKSLTNAGSAYLKGANIDSIGKTILYLPLRIFYFLYSPTPDMIRGVMDIGVFLLNSVIYLYTSLYGYKYYKIIKNTISKRKKLLINSLFISILMTVIVFAIGTSNAGTAMRHRDKIVIFMLALFGIIKNEYEKNKSKKRRNYGIQRYKIS